MNGDVLRGPCPNFREIQHKVRNKDIEAPDPYRLVKQTLSGNKVHPSNTDMTVSNPLKSGGGGGVREIGDI